MAVVALSNSITEPSKRLCKCYRVASLTETVLVGAGWTSNLKDQYVLGEQLGLGQFGVIRSCTDKVTGEVLACKSISKDRLVTSDDVRSIRLEIEIMTRLSGHPNVVDLKAVYEEEDHVHLLMELCAGGELFHKLEKHGRFSEPDARVLFRHLMQVVLYCHENGVVHRDLKPENILLATKASSSPIKVADFGLATYIKPGESLRGLVGSPFYIAPEVLAGGYNQAADVWSAGVILYILLSGTPPFWGKTKSKIFDAVKMADLRFPSSPWDRVSDPALDLIRRMLCTDPSQRLTAQQVLDHSWMTRSETQRGQLDRHEDQSCKEIKDHSRGSSFSAPFMSRNEDISFGNASAAISCDNQSPVFSCRSSFSSSFRGEPFTPFSEYAGFSFRSDGNSIGGTEIRSPAVQSMPSFAFFSSGFSVEKSNCIAEMAKLVEPLGKETSLDMLIHNSSVCFTEHLGSNNKTSEFKRSGGTTWSRTSGIHSKRNRTIGLGEREQIDLIVSESIIRWSSCTHFPTSCQSSLVF